MEPENIHAEPPASLATYLDQTKARRRLFQPSYAARSSTKGYTIDPIGAAPHSTPIHAMAMVQDASVLLSGGSDGYVRWYDLNASVNGKNMLTQNLRSSFVEGVTKGGVLTTWWGNAHLQANDPLSRTDAPLSPVHSLGCERDALWAISGGEGGNINLYGLRHDPGQLRHVFRRHTAAVSALALSDSQTELISGGWDRGVFQWDLNTGQVVRAFDGHIGQVSSIHFRPIHAPSNSQEMKQADAIEADYTQGTSPLEVEMHEELAPPCQDSRHETKLNGDLGSAPKSDNNTENDGENDNDSDSLFGEQNESAAEARVDGSGESADADGDSDDDADGETDLFRSPEVQLEAESGLDPSRQPTNQQGKSSGPWSLALPGQQRRESSRAQSTPEAQQHPIPETHSDQKPSADAKPKTNVGHLPKPMFGSTNTAGKYDADLTQFSSDILLTSTLSGQVLLWDRRVDTKGRPGVHALPLPPHTPPWCMSVCWNNAGDKIYVGRRNETVDEWDVRMLPDLCGSSTKSVTNAPSLLNILCLPKGSGPVNAVRMMPNDRHIVCASYDNVRLWETQPRNSSDIPFKIVAGHHGGTISEMLVDERAQFLLTSSGDRGWFSHSTETLLMHEITPL
ncbi:Transcription factor spt8 [Malassezia yamatoensis]|uniref:Transcription factor spt8 n=1 Tax=Malassezia yamatoensis TaxID=253288 RepID=A0AAJ5YWC5_9BASI|nr:Transcription factor spt8 [Malassezia yamatoensis]